MQKIKLTRARGGKIAINAESICYYCEATAMDEPTVGANTIIATMDGSEIEVTETYIEVDNLVGMCF